MTPGRALRGQNDDGKCSECQAGASIASCRFMFAWTWRRKNWVIHWSCWSPPGEPHARYGSPSRSAMVGVSVERGRFPGISAAGWSSSSQNICARVPRGKPSSGITGDECNQPPDGVAVTMLPAWSMMSKWTVSPGIAPIRSRACVTSGRWSSSWVQSMRPTVGSPAPEFSTAERAPEASRMSTCLPKPVTVPGRSFIEARSVISLRRCSL